MLLHTLFYTFVHTKIIIIIIIINALKYNKHCSNQIINKLNNHLDHATWIPTLNKFSKILCLLFLFFFYI